MCMLIYKPAGIAIPSWNNLFIWADSNPDGFGGVAFKEGVTSSFKSLCMDDAFDWIENLHEDTPAILHFRYATAGSKSRSNCHGWRVGKSKSYFAHNGTLPAFSWKNGLTDSQNFCDSLVADQLLYSENQYIRLAPKLVPYATASRFCIADGKKALLIGDWYEHKKGYFLSKVWDTRVTKSCKFRNGFGIYDEERGYLLRG